MAVVSVHLDDHLKRKLGVAGYSVSGSTITIPSVTIQASDLRELLNVATQARHEVSLVSGVLTIKPV